MDILDTIVDAKKQAVAVLKKNTTIEQLVKEIKPDIPSFKNAIKGRGKISIIAEVKKASPSRGVLRKDFDPVLIAKAYAQHGASALSVLTEEKHFLGSIDYLKAIAKEVKLPILCKDFIIDSIQLFQARAAGASAVLLIAAILDLDKLRDFIAVSRELGMDVLVEVHNAKELGLVLHTSADIIGINNRDLKDFSIDLNTTLRLAKLIPPSKVIVSESGILTKEDIPLGVDAVLVGEGLITNDSIFNN